MNRLVGWSALLAVALLVPAGADPQSADDAARAREERAARDRVLTAGLSRLDFLVGGWVGERSFPDAAGEWKPAGSAAFEVVRVQGGKALQTTVSSGGFTYLLYFSFDAEQDEYRITSLDDVSGLLDVYEGAFDPKGALVVSNLATGTGYTYLGVHHANRMTLARRDKGWEWLVEVSADGGRTWRPQLRATQHPASQS